MTVTTLPQPTTLHPPGPSTPRWVPSRAGILNVWRYYDEVFQFHRGRLLLRGENGTGKSKALELLLPFLFDANLRPHRLSTFGTGERTMHWNLMGDGASGATRVGYVWLEFRLGGPDDDDQETTRWFCCGARLQASVHTTTVHPDFFTTRLRIAAPDGLSLVTEAGAPLTRRALEERLGEDGEVHANATDYRAAVRTTLFPGMSEQRYDALITALLQLRTPKLSQRLDPALLSTLLSRALPPLDEQEIADLAEGFERLDRQRERLKALEQEVGGAATLAARQRTYSRRVLRAAAAALISATTRLDDLTKVARRSADEHQRVTEQRAALEKQVESLLSDTQTTEALISGITDSDSYREGQQLDRLRQQTVAALEQARKQRRQADRVQTQADEDAQAHAAAAQVAAQHVESVSQRQADSLRAATRAGLAGAHTEIASLLDTDPAAGRTMLRAAVRGRHDQLDQVRSALDQHDREVDRRHGVETDLEDARAELSTATKRLRDADQRHELAREQLVEQLRAWALSCRELLLPDPDRLAAAVDSETDLLGLVEKAAQAALQEVTRAETAVAAERASVAAHRDELDAEHERLTVEQDLPPAPPPFRTTDRESLTGSPLWRLVRFTDTTPNADQSGIEAALQASGLLDAWVGHTGAVEGHDLFADPAALPPTATSSLAQVLAPEPDAAVPEPVVARLLGAIAYGPRLPDDHPAAIGADGRWRMGALRGSWAKAEPTYIGVLARERARQRRLRQLRAELDQVQQDLATLDAQLTQLGVRRAALAGERADRPSHDALADTRQVRTRVEADVHAAEAIVHRRVAALAERERAVAATLRHLTARAATHSLPADRAALTTLAAAIDSFATQAETWLDGHGQLLTAWDRARDLADREQRSRREAELRASDAREAKEAHRTLAATLRGVEDAIGVGYQQLLAELDRLRYTASQLRTEHDRASSRIIELVQRLGELTARRETDASARDQATEIRDRAARRFRHLAGIGFAPDSDIDDLGAFQKSLAGSDGVRAALDAARSLAASWPQVTYAPRNLGDALHRLAESVHDCRTTLSGRADLDLETDEDVQLFTATVDGVRVGAAELLAILRAEAEQSHRDITDRERELFDRTLTGDTRRHLAARIRQADELVNAMNTRLERVRTASRVAVRLVWQVAPDLPAGTKAARDLLLRDPVRLSDSDTTALHQFFRDRIEQAKIEDTATSWEQQLAEVFDYTKWHQFVVKLDRSNGDGWQPLTRKLHGALSGGEKAIALHLPLFAAVAAHYQAVPEAPRIILLDEVFVGVDSTNRGQVFALLALLDLDLLLTSDHEWCTYRELNGIAIHQLLTGGDDDPAVTTARFVWDGMDLLSEPDSLPRVGS